MLDAKEAQRRSDRTLTDRVASRVDKYIVALMAELEKRCDQGFYAMQYAAPIDPGYNDDEVLFNHITKTLRDLGFEVPSAGLTGQPCMGEQRVIDVTIRWGDPKKGL